MLATAANDAGLIAQTLQAAGFDVIGARDLDGDTLRKSFHDFIQKAQNDGPNTVAMVYLSGYGVQIAGENYLFPSIPTSTARRIFQRRDCGSATTPASWPDFRSRRACSCWMRRDSSPSSEAAGSRSPAALHWSIPKTTS